MSDSENQGAKCEHVMCGDCGSGLHDNLNGPCACGAWHRENEIPVLEATIATLKAQLEAAEDETVECLKRRVLDEIVDYAKPYWDKGRLHHSECHWDGAVVLHCVTTCPERIRVAALEKRLIELGALSAPASDTGSEEGNG